MATNLVDSAGVGHGIGVLDDRDGLSSQDGLIDPEGGREDLGQPDVGGDLVADGDLNDVTGHDLLGADLLDTALVGTYDLTHLGLVLLQRLDGGLGVTLLPDTDNGVGDEDEQNDEGLDECREGIFVLLKQG